VKQLSPACNLPEKNPAAALHKVRKSDILFIFLIFRFAFAFAFGFTSVLLLLLVSNKIFLCLC